MAIDDITEEFILTINESISVDKKRYELFLNHECRCNSKGVPTTAIGADLTYMITGSSLGTILRLKCACGLEEDVTDYRGW